MTVPSMRRPSAGHTDGFTLLELMISLGLFALIAVAGLALLDGVLGVEGRTGNRLDRVADLQRAMYVIGSDLDQIAAGRMAGTAGGVGFARTAPGIGGIAVPVRYAMAGDTLVRIVGARPQRVLSGVSAARWRYFDGGWADRWPLADDRADDWPRAVSVDLTMADGGTLRRVVTLPIAVEPAS